MSKILLIIQREYLTRVKKKSFIIMSLLGPVIMALVMVVPIWLAQNSSDDQKVLVIDQSTIFEKKLESSSKIKFSFSELEFENAKKEFENLELDAILYIPKIDIEKPSGIVYYSENSPGIETKVFVEKRLSDRIVELKYKKIGFDKSLIEKLKSKVKVTTVSFSGDSEKETNTAAATIVGFVSAILIYMFILIYGAQVMRGVIEEKTNRIIEVIISSVKPFQLMMGKVIGVAMVGLTQFIIWMVLMLVLSTGIQTVFKVDRFSSNNLEQTLTKTQGIDVNQAMEMNEILSAIESIDFFTIGACFLFYFLAGYLFYGALFAAIGAAVDSETDSQQFMVPVTIPLIVGIMIGQAIMTNPEGGLGFWSSMVPFTSPIVMMIRLPFIGFGWEVLLSMFMLVLGFLGTIWLAAKIYRVGILMYGKKPTYKELVKWVFYKS